jgi:AraC-like DNA-binding protein
MTIRNRQLAPAPPPTVGAGLINAWFDYVAAKGVNSVDLASQAGLKNHPLYDHNSRIPFASYIALVRAAKKLCNDPALPLRFAQDVDVSEFSITGLLANASETMLDALKQINRYGRLVTDVGANGKDRFLIEQVRDEHWVIDTREFPEHWPELTESTFTHLICGPRRFLSIPHILAAEVTYPEPSCHREYERIWRIPITFGARRNALRFDPSIYTKPVRIQPRYVFGVLSAHADALVEELVANKTVRGQVEALLMSVIHKGDASASGAAALMGISRQTLYRKLKAEGVTFEQVLDDLRHRLALAYLEGGKASVSETAYLVGFSEPSAFSRAFKRWTGASPRNA